METDLWGIPSKHPKLSKISCFSTHTVRPPSLVIPGFVLNGHGGSPHISHPGNSEVSSFQERPRLLAAAEDPEVHLKSMAKCWGTCHGMLGVSVFIWDHIIIWYHLRMVARSIFCRFRRCLNEIWLDLTFLSAFLIAQTCRWLNSFLQTAIAFLLKCKSQTCPDNNFSSLLMDVNHHPIVKYPFCNPLNIHFYLIGFIG